MGKPKDQIWQYFDVICEKSKRKRKRDVKCKSCSHIIYKAEAEKLRAHFALCSQKKDQAPTNEAPLASSSKIKEPTTSSKTMNDDKALSKAIKAVQNGGKLSHVSLKYNIPVSYLFLQITRLKLREKSNIKKKDNTKEKASTKAKTAKKKDLIEQDEFRTIDGMIVSDRLFLKKIYFKNKVVVSKELYKAIQESKKGQLCLDALAKKYEVNTITLRSKLRKLAKLNPSTSKDVANTDSSMKEKDDSIPSLTPINDNSSTDNTDGKLSLDEPADLELRDKTEPKPSTSESGSNASNSLENVDDSSSTNNECTNEPHDAPSSEGCLSNSYSEKVNFLKKEQLIHLSSAMSNALMSIDNGMNYSSAARIHKLNIKVLHMFCNRLRGFSMKNLKKKSGTPELNKLQIQFGEFKMDPEEFDANLILVRQRVRHLSYTVSQLASALMAINHSENMGSVSQKYQIPYATLFAAVSRIGLVVNRHYKARKKMEACEPPEESCSDLTPAQIPTESTVDLDSDETKEIIMESSPFCQFCHQPGHREVEIGTLHFFDTIVVHYYCLLFSCALEQNGEDDEGILGFLPEDIKKELRRGSKLRCSYCGQTGATIGCSNKQCRKKYHFPCGLDHFTQFSFCDNFCSYCEHHRNYQKGIMIGKEVECSICMENMVVDPKYAVWPPCCRRSSWFHRTCLQKLALSAGYFFKCPLCNDKKRFIKQMLKEGIFVPERDASWELEPNAYEELLERPVLCDAPKCLCPKGRKGNANSGKWELLFCTLCGSIAIHSGCQKERVSKSKYACVSCKEILKGCKRHEKPRTSGRKRKLQACNNKEVRQSTAEKRIRLDDESAVAPSSSASRAKKFKLSMSTTQYILQMRQAPEIAPQAIIREQELYQNSNLGSIKDLIIFSKRIRRSFGKRGLTFETVDSLCLKNASCSVKIKDELIDKFSERSLRYDQMFFMHKLILLMFILQKNLKSNKGEELLKKELIELLKDGVSLFKNMKDCIDITFLLSEEVPTFPQSPTGVLPTESLKEDDDPTKQMGEASTRFVRIAAISEITELCRWCQKQLLPGVFPTTVDLKTGNFTIICIYCKTCIIMEHVFKEAIVPDDSVERIPRESAVCNSFKIEVEEMEVFNMGENDAYEKSQNEITKKSPKTEFILEEKLEEFKGFNGAQKNNREEDWKTPFRFLEANECKQSTNSLDQAMNPTGSRKCGSGISKISPLTTAAASFTLNSGTLPDPAINPMRIESQIPKINENKRIHLPEMAEGKEMIGQVLIKTEFSSPSSMSLHSHSSQVDNTSLDPISSSPCCNTSKIKNNFDEASIGGSENLMSSQTNPRTESKSILEAALPVLHKSSTQKASSSFRQQLESPVPLTRNISGSSISYRSKDSLLPAAARFPSCHQQSNFKFPSQFLNMYHPAIESVSDSPHLSLAEYLPSPNGGMSLKGKIKAKVDHLRGETVEIETGQWSCKEKEPSQSLIKDSDLDQKDGVKTRAMHLNEGSLDESIATRQTIKLKKLTVTFISDTTVKPLFEPQVHHSSNVAIKSTTTSHESSTLTGESLPHLVTKYESSDKEVQVPNQIVSPPSHQDSANSATEMTEPFNTASFIKMTVPLNATADETVCSNSFPESSIVNKDDGVDKGLLPFSVPDVATSLIGASTKETSTSSESQHSFVSASESDSSSVADSSFCCFTISRVEGNYSKFNSESEVEDG